ncbi:hypothetical protein BN2497_2423 [Janthinobacterium sp. CG23_2]|nr:hypothetical protein BN2497_2423 [Janthinobacterium sp. CG23_2]CUU27609.1 hypothetical protein BN3177_2423 [Janthinobacterium sp. CG23_2]
MWRLRTGPVSGGKPARISVAHRSVLLPQEDRWRVLSGQDRFKTDAA